jgi:hypothetical protein
MMTAKQFQPFVERDGGRCLHCGTTEGLVPQHRQGGMGGGRMKNRASNVITFCGAYNGAIESSAEQAEIARAHGWKLRPGDDPLTRPVFDRMAGEWYFLDDDYNRTKA